jgi:hypothetical protein
MAAGLDEQSLLWPISFYVSHNNNNKIIIKCYSRSLCKTLEVFACAGANLVRASDLPDPSVSGRSEWVREGEEQVRGHQSFAMMVVIAGGKFEGGDCEPPESRWSVDSVLWYQRKSFTFLINWRLP